MAEARQAVGTIPAFGLHEFSVDTNYHHIQVSFTQKGFMLFIPHPRFIIRNTLRFVWCVRNRVQQACVPIPMWLVTAIVSGVTAYSTRLPRSTPAIDFALRMRQHILPKAIKVRPQWEVPCATLTVSVAALFLCSATQRLLLRKLLGYTGWIHEVRGRKSIKTVVWGLLLKYVYIRRNKNPKLLTYQNCLPNLPLPTLETTTQRCMETIAPIVTAQELNELQQTLCSFLKNEGPKLQSKLRLKHMFSDNYVADWWLNLVYLRGRDSITINSNYYGLGLAFDQPCTNQVSRAAKMIQLCVRTYLDIKQQKLMPQLLQGMVPLCMNQYRYAFAVTREPHRDQDQLVKYEESRHIVVMHKGRMFSLECFSQKSRKPLTARQLEATLQGIVNDQSPANEIEASIPVLTNLDRTKWAEIRGQCFLQGGVLNARALETIERALFLVSLEDFAPKPQDWTAEAMCYYIGNDGRNRWVDKCFTMIVCANGRCGLQAEHSWGDAAALTHLFEAVFAREAREDPYDADGFVKKVAKDLDKESRSKAVSHPAQRIMFHVTPELEAHVKQAIPVVRSMLGDLHLSVTCFEKYGKGLMKTFKCGPDSWIQMALQLAYRRDQGRFDQTYESGTTRLFQLGRTETIRSVSQESCEWVLAMDDAAVGKDQKRELLVKACARHQQYSQWAMIGRGVDRHMFALYVVSVGTGMQSEFLSRIMKRKWKLSTSQIPQRQTQPYEWPNNDQGDDKRYIIGSGGFGPVADDGYGVCYTIPGEGRIFFHVTSKRSCKTTDATRLASQIERALCDMQAVFQ